MERTITLSEIATCSTWTVKDNSPRGCKTASAAAVKVGDMVVVNNYFTRVIDDPQPETATEAAETAEAAEPANQAETAAAAENAAETLTEAENAETEPSEEDRKEVDALAALDRATDALKARKDRSAWNKGVTLYAAELLEGLWEAVEGGYFDPEDLAAPKLLERAMLNGAGDWNQYSWGGSSLIYDGDIARRLCSPSELRKTREGERRPNASEEWLDTQARALFQAANRVQDTIRAALAGTKRA